MQRLLEWQAQDSFMEIMELPMRHHQGKVYQALQCDIVNLLRHLDTNLMGQAEILM